MTYTQSSLESSISDISLRLYQTYIHHQHLSKRNTPTSYAETQRLYSTLLTLYQQYQLYTSTLETLYNITSTDPPYLTTIITLLSSDIPVITDETSCPLYTTNITDTPTNVTDPSQSYDLTESEVTTITGPTTYHRPT